MSENPDLPPTPTPGEQPKQLSPLAQTFQAIGQTAFKLGMAGSRPSPYTELDYPMWSAAANLTMGEYRAARRLKAAWLNGSKAG